MVITLYTEVLTDKLIKYELSDLYPEHAIGTTFNHNLSTYRIDSVEENSYAEYDCIILIIKCIVEGDKGGQD